MTTTTTRLTNQETARFIILTCGATMAPSEQPVSVIYLYREKSAPCFLWTLVLAPCLCPMVWYVCLLSVGECLSVYNLISLIPSNRKYHVTITENELSIGYSSGCMQVSFDRSCILEAEEIPHINGLCEWGGYGIRKQLPSWDTGYIARNGPGVRVRVKRVNGKETNYFFSCHDPAEVVRILTT